MNRHSLDGANFWQRTFLVIVPMISRTIEYGAIMSIVWTFTGIFAFIYSDHVWRSWV